MTTSQKLLILFSLSATTLISCFSPSTPLLIRKKSSALSSIPNPLDTLTSGLASICRLPNGVTAINEDESKFQEEDRPKLKELYDVENSVDCRRVREKVTEFDLVVEKVIPAASNSRVFSESSFEYSLPQGTTIPRLVLTESDKERILSGVDEIVSYLDDKFDGRPPPPSDEDTKDKIIAALQQVGNYVATFLRNGRGMKVSPAGGKKAPRPEKPLVLYSYEGNQFCRLVREVLTELDIVYELRSAGKGSARRSELAEITGGSTQCPYLSDPNTSVSMPESADIIRYLYKTYGLWTPPSELLQWASDVILPAAKPLFAKLAPLQAGSNREDKETYEREIKEAKAKIEAVRDPVVVYTYGLSPFSSETKALLDNLDISYKEISLGAEWLPGLIKEDGSQTRAALLEMTGQSSLPHVFIGGKSVGGLYSGTPGLVPALEEGTLMDMVSSAITAQPGVPVSDA